VTRAALIVTVALAAYAFLSTILAWLLAVLWRTGVFAARRAGPADQANLLVAMRIAPAAIAAILTIGVVLPVYLAFEPIRDYEPVGPVPLLLAALGVTVLAAATVVAVRTALVTYRVKRQWLRDATALDIHPPAGVSAYVIDVPSPIVALVGVFSPRLVAARAVIEACSTEELAAIVAHERGHLVARDNFKRWVLASAPDVLRWTATHDDIIAAWRDAAEDAADDAATRGEAVARVDLAALLLKVARLAPRFSTPAAVSPFADEEGLDRRVRRLLTASHAPLTASRRVMVPAVLAAAIALTVTVAFTNPAALKRVYEIVELAVVLGR
jgi:beta-lactamase regulating signal transducer with metallopeptidase domain